MIDLPYLTAEQPGTGGQLKTRPEDFFVEEIPLYLPGGEGQHVYATIEKRGMATHAAINKIARALQIKASTIGYAGLKDAQAITRQTLSLNNVSPEAVESLDIPDIKILAVKRHRNKLKIGHLAGNRFVIRVRQVKESAVPVAKAVLSILQMKGAPNFFGEQRFGNRNNTHLLGEALVRGDAARFLAEYLGHPHPNERADLQAARQLVDEGRLEEALAQWPPKFSTERKMLKAIVKANGQVDIAPKILDRKLKNLFVSAFQSALFNQLLLHRLDALDRLEDGDVAFIHGKGAAFVVEEAAVEQPRADQFEISPSGPLFGPRTLMPEGKPGQRERSLLADLGLTLEDFNISGLRVRGTRRPYRFKIENASVWWDEDLMVAFELPPGTYATTVMAEIMKNR